MVCVRTGNGVGDVVSRCLLRGMPDVFKRNIYGESDWDDGTTCKRDGQINRKQHFVPFGSLPFLSHIDTLNENQRFFSLVLLRFFFIAFFCFFFYFVFLFFSAVSLLSSFLFFEIFFPFFLLAFWSVCFWKFNVYFPRISLERLNEPFADSSNVFHRISIVFPLRCFRSSRHYFGTHLSHRLTNPAQQK